MLKGPASEPLHIHNIIGMQADLLSRATTANVPHNRRSISATREQHGSFLVPMHAEYRSLMHRHDEM